MKVIIPVTIESNRTLSLSPYKLYCTCIRKQLKQRCSANLAPCRTVLMKQKGVRAKIASLECKAS